MTNLHRPVLMVSEWGDQATLTGFTTAAERPLTNLQRIQPSDQAQSLNLSSLTIDADRGEAAGFNAVALLFSNASSTATYRLRAGSDPTFASTLMDSSDGFGLAIHFDGDNDQVTIAGGAALNVGTFTLEARVRPQELREQGILARTGGALSAVVSMTAAGKIRFQGSPGAIGLVTTPSALTVGEYVHVAAAYSSAAQTMTLFLNGVQVAQTTGVVATFDGNGFSISPMDTNMFSGAIDDVRFWNFARSAAQITADYWKPLVGNETGLIGYWTLDEDTGTAAADSSPSNLDGVVSGVPLRVYPTRFWASEDLSTYADRNSWWWLPEGVWARYLRVDIQDAFNADGYFRAGRLMVGAGHQFTRGALYGSAFVGYLDESPLTRTPASQTVINRRPPIKTGRFGIRSQSLDEMLYLVSEFDRLLGSSREVLAVMDPIETVYQQELMHYARMTNLAPYVDEAWSLYAKEYAFEALL